jgi:hypothetical protein
MLGFYENERNGLLYPTIAMVSFTVYSTGITSTLNATIF